MIDSPVAVTFAPAADVIVLDLWDGAQPDVANVRPLQVEPQRWWLIDAAAQAEALTAHIGESGALTPIGGGLTRATLTGPGWRELLTISGFFDVENPDFRSGMVAATTIHHVPVWIAPIAADACEVFLPNSYAPTLADLWSRYAAEKGGSS